MPLPPLSSPSHFLHFCLIPKASFCRFLFLFSICAITRAFRSPRSFATSKFRRMSSFYSFTGTPLTERSTSLRSNISTSALPLKLFLLFASEPPYLNAPSLVPSTLTFSSLLFGIGACCSGFEPVFRDSSLSFRIRVCFTGFEPALQEGSPSQMF